MTPPDTRHAEPSISVRVTESRVPTEHHAPAKSATAARTRDVGQRRSQGSPSKRQPSDSKLRRDVRPETEAGADAQTRQQHRPEHDRSAGNQLERGDVYDVGPWVPHESLSRQGLTT